MFIRSDQSRGLQVPFPIHGVARVLGPIGLAIATAALVGTCTTKRESYPDVAPPPPSGRAADRVLVVHDLRDPGSIAVADRYCLRRSIRADHRVAIEAEPVDEISLADYRVQIEAPIRAVLESVGRRDSVDFIVLARGMPLRIRENGCSVDAFLGAMDLLLEPSPRREPAALRQLANPYYARRERFRHCKFGTYLVTRLDGYEVADAVALVDRSLAARPEPGPFLLDLDPRRDQPGYGELNAAARRAADLLRGRGLQVTLEETKAFVLGPGPLAGYFSWGSNDGSFDPAVYRSLRFLPGALAETAVSTSGRTFRPCAGGQSLVADLVRSGVTGVKGYVSEPLTLSLCRADILFDRYTAGYTLAESFAAASPLVKWKDVVVGDPLCAPYAPAGRSTRRQERPSRD
jgi:uncharacterized protein (TIGR03790 family)